VRSYSGAVNVAWFGAIGDDLVDDTVSIQAAHSTGENVDYGPGSYLINTAIQCAIGQIVTGYTSANFGTGKATIITNSVEGGGVFWYTDDTTTGQRKMPTIKNFKLAADYPIRFNNETTAIVVDGGGSNVPYGMKPFVINCDLAPRIAGTGIGISWSKMFDGAIEDCEIQQFDINVLLNGCDLNRVQHNRLRFGYSFQILELSANTFSSQNEISHNDILVAGSTSCIFYKTTARHARFYNNYLEQASGTPGAALVGFIDASDVDAPSYAGNVSGGRYSTIIRDNRIDGIKYASAFVYRYEPGGQTYGEIVDVGQTGDQVTPPAVGLAIVDAAGAITNELPYLYGHARFASYRFAGPFLYGWDGFSTDQIIDYKVTARNVQMVGTSVLYSNLFHDYLRASKDRIVFKDGFTSAGKITYPANSGHFKLSATYRVTITARVTGGAETLSFARILNEAGSALNNFALSTEFKEYAINITTGPNASDVNGIYMQRTNNGNDIEIKSIAFQEIFYGQSVYDPPSLADGEGINTSVVVPGAVLGDFSVASFTQNLAQVTVTSYVAATDTVVVRFQNESGGVVNLASGTLQVKVSKP
jgi:hypothetical protein